MTMDSTCEGVRRLMRASLLLLIFAQMLPLREAVAAEPIRISVSRTPLSLPIFVAESRGYFAAEGLPVRISEVIGGHRTLQQVFDGSADMATSSDAVVMFNSFKRDDYAVIATFVSSDDDLRLVTRASTGITRVPQLAGKRVATVVGASSHYFLDNSLLLNGVDPRTVQIKNMQPEMMVEALQKGEVDAIAIWEPYPFQALAKVSDAKVLPKSGGYVESFNLIISKKLQGVRDDDLVKLLRALDRAQQFIASEPGRAKFILRERLQVDEKFIDSIWPRYNYRNSLNQSLLTTLEGEARWARREGHVKAEQSPNYLDFIYALPLRRVRPAAVNIRD